MRGTIVRLRRALRPRRVSCLEAQFSFLLFGCLTAAAECADPAAYVHSAASITRHFSDEERKTDARLLGARGTAWFLSSESIITAAHVTQGMHLQEETWKEIEITLAENAQSIDVRVKRLAGSGTEKIALLELRRAFPGAQAFQIRTAPLATGERVVSLAFPSGALRFAEGRFIRYEDEGKVSGVALLEMYDGNDRLVLDHGASGAPVLDCDGRVVAVVSNIFAKTIPFMSQAIRVSTAWGNPNIASLPISALAPDSKAE